MGGGTPTMLLSVQGLAARGRYKDDIGTKESQEHKRRRDEGDGECANNKKMQ